ncbi:Fungalysin metallopeptidase-domain-containing protein [Collybia nuda]|uniref:Extracellular metalloproteinase n=1 Tax=Collybia nuda TaxID=64659 RepID=A0A9P5XTX2_9AGAR|nr:Fungalysin metallopeptidase-domain-containing protein [Collybia nuda]
MGNHTKLLRSVLVAIVYASATIALVAAPGNKHATHRDLLIKKDLKITVFHPESSFGTFDQGIEHPLSKSSSSTIESSTLSFIASRLKVDSSAIKFRTSHLGEITSHAYVSQVHDGISFANAVANVAFNRGNKVVAFGSSFVTPKTIAPSTPAITLKAAITTAENVLDGKFNDHPPTVEYLVKDDESVVLTHVVQIQNDAAGAWYQAFVDAHSGELVSAVNFVTDVTYLALPITSEVPTQGFQNITNPQDMTASPFGWHSTTGTTNTSGNNVQVPTTSALNGNFIYPLDPTAAPTTTGNMNAARVNAFYVANSLHDLAYRSSAFNFQTNNFGKGGAQNDPVTISVQDKAGTNNADFATPPDGQSGMFLWTFSLPQRDGALENDIVTHEFTHGITNRITGGGTGRCLQTTEAGGMGEGWSDAMANLVEHTSSAVPDYVLGQYVTNSPAGIRTHPYSTSATTNPLRYSSIKTLNEVHNIGEVWANTLHNMYAALVAARGWNPLFGTTNPPPPPGDGSGGNYIFLHLFIDALALQPCNPTFVSARDAWIQADVNRFGGANKCTIWHAFASRGLGVGAANFVDSSAVPSGC